VPARLIFHDIKIGRSARAGKAAVMENGLQAKRLEYFTYAVFLILLSLANST
jgi:hypothetical protein